MFISTKDIIGDIRAEIKLLQTASDSTAFVNETFSDAETEPSVYTRNFLVVKKLASFESVFAKY